MTAASANEERLAPLSFGQQGLHFFDRQAPDSALYSIPYRFDIDGPLDPAALDRACRSLLQRHDVLRTCFVEREGSFYQNVLPSISFSLPSEDLAGVVEQEQLVESIAAAFASAPFDLTRGPLFFARLLHLGPDRHVFLLRMHHIVFDGWSYGILTHELDVSYRAARSGRAPQLAALPLQFADYARWQRQRLEDHSLDEELAYWKRTLQGAPPLLTLPTDRPRPAVPGYSGRTLDFEFTPELSSGVIALARALAVTPFVLLSAAVSLLMARYSGQTDICLGFPIDGRGHTDLEAEDLIGFFANTLVLRTSVVPGATFRQLVETTRLAMLGAMEHGELPFDKLVESIAPTRSMAHHPLFQVTLTYQSVDDEWRMGNLNVTHKPCPSNISKFDLTFDFEKRRDRFRICLEYADELFLEGTLREMMGELTRSLTQVVADPDTVAADSLPTPTAAAPVRSLRKRR
jgi:Condensation domain